MIAQAVADGSLPPMGAAADALAVLRSGPGRGDGSDDIIGDARINNVQNVGK